MILIECITFHFNHTAEIINMCPKEPKSVLLLLNEKDLRLSAAGDHTLQWG